MKKLDLYYRFSSYFIILDISMSKEASTRFPPIKDALRESKHDDTPITNYRRLQPPSIHKLQDSETVPDNIKCRSSLGRCLLNKLFNCSPVTPPVPGILFLLIYSRKN